MYVLFCLILGSPLATWSWWSVDPQGKLANLVRLVVRGRLGRRRVGAHKRNIV